MRMRMGSWAFSQLQAASAPRLRDVLVEACAFERRTMPAGRCPSRVVTRMFVRQPEVSQEGQCEWLRK